jgi:invasion protein IalB
LRPRRLLSLVATIVASAMTLGVSAAPGEDRSASRTPRLRLAEESAPPRPIPAKPDSKPDVMTATYGAWTLRCARNQNAEGDAKSCFVLQILALQTGGKPVAQIFFTFPPTALAPVVLHGVLVLPHDMTIAVAPKIESRENDFPPLVYEWRRCLAAGCVAELDLTPAQVDALRAADRPLALGFADGAGRKIALVLPVSGFRDALDALMKIAPVAQGVAKPPAATPGMVKPNL